MRRMNAAFLAALLSLTTTPAFVSADPLPGTQTLTDSRDLARVMVDGIHAYLDRELKDAPKKRDELWKVKANEPIAAKRERLKKLLGVVDAREPWNFERYAPQDGTDLVETIDDCQIRRVKWAVLPGIKAEGLFITGKGDRRRELVIAIPHGGLTAESLASCGEDDDDFALRLARHGFDVLIPKLLDRSDEHSGNLRLNRLTNQPHREFLHRMAYEMGRTVTGLEVQSVLAAMSDRNGIDQVGVIGFGDGGRVALYAAALDERIKLCHIAGAFGQSDTLWQQTLDRNVWGLLREFGDAEVAAMISPRKLIVDSMTAPKWNGPVMGKPGRSGATPGKLTSVSNEDLKREFDRISLLAKRSSQLIDNSSQEVKTDVFLTKLGVKNTVIGDAIRNAQPVVNLDYNEKPSVIQKRLLDQSVNFIQSLWRNSEPVRKEFWKKADASSPEAWEKSCDWYREYFHDEIIGRLPKPTMPLNPKSRQIYDTPKWTGHEVTLDVYPDVMAYGILLLPKDLKPGEKRPVVVCQHGLEGRPTDVCNPKERTKYYLSFGAQLADKGYIVFAPQNPYIFDDHFRQILRKANPLKLSLFSFIIRQHERILDWLETQPYVDPKRIAFYGLSYGGKTAMRVPAVEKRYCLSICSGDFNEWIGKIVSTELPMSYMYTKEYDMLEFNLGHTFNYAEMAYLIAPRPFMVERGHDDGVGIDEMVAYEFAKVRYLYANKLKIPDRTDIEFFPGGHQINGKGTFEFLQRHLQYPK